MNIRKNSYYIFLPLLSLLIILSHSLAAQTDYEKKTALRPVEYNLKELVKQAAVGVIAPPGFGSSPYRIDPNGNLHVVPGIGSITFNFRTGDSAYYLAGDHV